MSEPSILDPPLSRAIDSLATRYWLATLMKRAKTSSCYQLEKMFATPEQLNAPNWSWNRSRRFNKNLKGVPVKDKRLIADVERQFPGTQRCLDHPVWLVMKEPHATQARLDEIASLLPPDLLNRLFIVDESTGASNRRRQFSNVQVQRIELLGTLDALACLLILLREADIQGRPLAHYELNWAAHSLFLRLASFPPLSDFVSDMYLLLFEHFFRYDYSVLKSVVPFIRPPEKTVFITIATNTNTFIVKLAMELGIVSTPRDQMRFLFWADYGPKSEILAALIAASRSGDIVSTESPYPLGTLLRIMRDGIRRGARVWR